jgi:hypothetical protein
LTIRNSNLRRTSWNLNEVQNIPRRVPCTLRVHHSPKGDGG